MRHPFTLRIGGVIAIAVAFIGPVPAEAPDDLVPAADVAAALRGKVCATKGGATFTFTKDGHYAYDGMWTDSGHYSVHDGVVTILLDSGLGRDFTISRHDGVLYMEQTAIRCTAGEAPSRTGTAMAPHR